MNVFQLSCRNFRPLAALSLAILFLYVIVNVVYIMFIDDITTSSDTAISGSVVDDPHSINANLKFGKPDANGKIEVVLSLDKKQLANLLDNGVLDGVLKDDSDGDDRPARLPPLTGAPPSNVSFTLHNPALCSRLDSETEFNWIVAVSSAPSSSEKRSLLRETWANTGLFRKQRFVTIFLLGLTDDSAIQERVRAEYNEHKDIVQGNFLDTARNSTLKGLMALQFVLRHCSSTAYVVKVNDDSFVNVFEMMRLMEAASRHRNAVICPIWQDNTMRILRDPNTCMEWCVADNELPGRTHFPQYCAGLAFVMSHDLIPVLYKESGSTPYFWIDDVYITGLLMPRVAALYGTIHYVDIIRNFTQVEQEMEKQYSDKSKPITYLVSKIVTPSIFRRVWKALLNRLLPSQFKLLSDSTIAGM